MQMLQIGAPLLQHFRFSVSPRSSSFPRKEIPAAADRGFHIPKKRPLCFERDASTAVYRKRHPVRSNA